MSNPYNLYYYYFFNSLPYPTFLSIILLYLTAIYTNYQILLLATQTFVFTNLNHSSNQSSTLLLIVFHRGIYLKLLIKYEAD